MGSKLSQWMKRVQLTQDEEIDCSECLERVSEYVDLELAGSQPGYHMVQVRQHLDQCRVCREEYLLLRDLARMEGEGKAPGLEDLEESLKKRTR